MCLIIQKGQGGFIAEEDIIVYKIAMHDGLIYTTYHREFPFNLGETYHSEIEIEERYNCLTIGKGLHSYKFKSAVLTYSLLNPKKIKCIIPKGSKCFSGWFDGDEAYVSDTLTYLEEIK
jgi:hypothetical protein